MKIIQIFFQLFLLLQFHFSMAQSSRDTLSKLETDSLKNEKLTISLDVVSRYIWRGQAWGGSYTVFQPNIEYKLGKKIVLGSWATHNFKKEYFYPDNEVFYKGYQELDLYISYDINSILSLKLWDYYWPSVSKVEGVNNNFFNYGKNSSKTLDFNVLIDFEKVGQPLNVMISTLVAGNDFRYDTNGNAHQNFTTYVETSYTYSKIKKIEINPTVGLVLNNQAGYYTSGNYQKPSFVNLSMNIAYELFTYKKFSIPVYLNYIHNASSKNTECFGRNFLLCGATLKYN